MFPFPFIVLPVTEKIRGEFVNASGRVGQILSRLVLLALLALQACGGGDVDAPADANRAEALALTPAQAALARWSAPVALSLVPVGGSLLPNGKVLFWSAEDRYAFYTTPFNGRTWTSLYDPASTPPAASERLVSETAHNMFCPGTSNLPDGRILINGGIDSASTSIYDPFDNTWSTAARMNIPRGYQGNATLRDGSVLTLGGSWSGGAAGNRHGEIWTASGGWRRLTGVPIDSMLSIDTSREFGGDSHAWLVPTANGRVLYAGPSVNMQWIGTTGPGSVEAAGVRGDDAFSINGIAVMYDAGKILKSGGASGYEGFAANANSYVIDTTSGAAVVRKIPLMAYQRAFHNAAVLPNGQVVVIGGQTVEQAFSDNYSVLPAELFDPASESWTTLPAMATPRNYHSIALLLPDARVLAGGGGLCGVGCAGNHADFEVLSPHYLFNADGSAATRPAILTAPASTGYGTTITVSTDAAVTAFSMVRIGTATHTVNNDQRRVALSHTDNGGGSYSLQVPSNPGILLPGYWMLFAMNAQDTPSVAKIIRVDAATAPKLEAVAYQNGTVGSAVSLALSASDPTGAGLSYSALGLPAGLAIDPATGVISGTPTTAGRSLVTVTAANGAQKTSSDFVWTSLQWRDHLDSLRHRRRHLQLQRHAHRALRCQRSICDAYRYRLDRLHQRRIRRPGLRRAQGLRLLRHRSRHRVCAGVRACRRHLHERTDRDAVQQHCRSLDPLHHQRKHADDRLDALHRPDHGQHEYHGAGAGQCARAGRQRRRIGHLHNRRWRWRWRRHLGALRR